MIIRNKSGSIFIFAMWTVLILTTFGIYIGYNARMRLSFVKRLETRDRLRALVEAGVHTLVNDVHMGSLKTTQFVFVKKDPDGGMTRDAEPGEYDELTYNYEVDTEDGPAYCKMTDEQGRLNVNTANHREIERILMSAGLEEERANELAYNIEDWRDEDNERPELNVINNEDLYYKMEGMKYSPKNKPFELVEELLLVKGMTPGIYKNIEQYVTVYGSGAVNINTCSRVVMSSLGLDKSLIDKIYIYKSGVRTHNREKGEQFSSSDDIIDELSSTVSLKKEEWDILEYFIEQGKITGQSNCFRVKSLARHSREHASLECVFHRDGTIMYWKENFKQFN